MKQVSVEAVEKVLGNPVVAEFSENAIKVRRNLLVVGVISIFVVIGGIKINPSSSIFGFTFVGLTDELIKNGLLMITAYLLIHFLWYVIDGLSEWRLRLTGTRLAFVTTGRVASEHADYPNDPRQSTLYYWWLQESQKIGELGTGLAKLKAEIEKWDGLLCEMMQDKADSLNLSNAVSTIGRAQSVAHNLDASIKLLEETLTAQRIPVSLKRFNQWFHFFLRSQNLRWILIDVMAPLMVGFFAMFLLLRNG